MHGELAYLNGKVAACLAFAVLALTFGQVSHASSTAEKPAGNVSKYLTPSTMSSACRTDARRGSACVVVSRFFRAVNSGNYERACSLLGKRLQDENRGLGCPTFLSLGSPEPMPWGILGAKLADSGIAVLVTLGQPELDHFRMRHHRAYVGVEGGRLRILETRLVR